MGEGAAGGIRGAVEIKGSGGCTLPGCVTLSQPSTPHFPSGKWGEKDLMEDFCKRTMTDTPGWSHSGQSRGQDGALGSDLLPQADGRLWDSHTLLTVGRDDEARRTDTQVPCWQWDVCLSRLKDILTARTPEHITRSPGLRPPPPLHRADLPPPSTVFGTVQDVAQNCRRAEHMNNEAVPSTSHHRSRSQKALDGAERLRDVWSQSWTRLGAKSSCPAE
ncbi:uncharacterized protein LOC122210288 [Panthera leo]|uniref:uncharacterized protein LOC122210288 n=1 Tax=Panthera leo TaxID=9689 RepID=UPI001C6A8985|nr:uncharacterized protein LOC122210288 [Panthera leo]